MQLNVRALVALSHAALRVMVPRRSGGLLNVASTASFQPGPGNATYSATKSFVRSFTEALHEEVLSSNVHVTALCPGFTRTAFHGRAGMEANLLPRFMWGEPMAVAVAGLEALDRNQAVCIPGIMNELGAASVRFAPRSVARKVAGRRSSPRHIVGAGQCTEDQARHPAAGPWVSPASELRVEGVVVDRPALPRQRVDELDGLGLLV